MLKLTLVMELRALLSSAVHPLVAIVVCVS